MKRNKLCEIILINLTNNILRERSQNIFIFKVKKKKAIHGDSNEKCYCLWGGGKSSD